MAAATAGSSTTIIKGEDVFRAFHGIKRLMLMNLGLNHSLSRAIRFTMFVGADIQDGLSQAQQQGKIKSNTFGRGFEAGEKATVGCSYRGRIWSYKVASDIWEWVEWCHSVGEKVLDGNISFDRSILPYLLIPKEISSRPGHVPVMIEWSDELLKRSEEYITIDFGSTIVPFFEVGLELVAPSVSGPLVFRVFTDNQSYEYEVVFAGSDVIYRARQRDLELHFGKKITVRLSNFFQKEPPVFYFDNGGFLVYNRYCELNLDSRVPFDAERIEAWEWTGVDIRVESQTQQKLANSIQRAVIETITAPAWEVAYDFVVDDDSANEAADVVAIKVEGDEILIHLFHCKYSKEAPGARVKDFYELCGQAQRSARWKHGVAALLRRMLLREATRLKTGGVSRFERGSKEVLNSIKNRCHLLKPRLCIFMVQPGLSKHQVSKNILELFATTEDYIKDLSEGTLRIIASA